jgi:hypothetical protein
MDCRTARLLLDFARPSRPELPADDLDALDAHLLGCAECEALSRAERAADVRLAQAMREVSLPEGLRERIGARLETERGHRQRRRVAWTLRAAIAAAILFVSCWFGWSRYAKPKPELDLERLHYDVVMNLPQEPDKVKQGFLDHYNVKTPTPTAFNYAFLKFYAVADCQNQRVPFLFFERGDTEARVFVISSGRFNLDGLEPGPAIDSGGYRVEVVRDDTDHAFVVVYKGESLRPLLAEANSAQ